MHFRVFDCWRLTAAMLIMAYHFLFSAPPSGEVGLEVLHRLLPLLDMFFMISGFLITGRYRSRLTSPQAFGGFFLRRIARLYPLHLLTLAFFAAIAVLIALGVVHTGEPQRWNLADLPFNVLAVQAWGTTDVLEFNYASWSVSAEFFCYMLFPLIVVAYGRAGLKGLVALLALWVGGLEVASAHGVFPGGHWTTADTLGAWRAFPDFVLGGIVAILVERRVVDLRSHLPGLVCLGFAVAAMLLKWHVYLALGGFAAAMLFTALAETARPDSTRMLAPLMPLARVSFGIYLWHPVMETLFFTLLWERVLQPAGFTGFYLYWLLPMAATIAVALLSERYFERPAGALIAGRGRDRSAPTALLA
ncbi:acyltransferase [Aurantimonas sp. MSK8Z-1]|uniref:acyltransferase family protein n=1 Tax=Mangrovibrevibacter kandeliae TaxID=2968473 RepID=UPI002117DB5D|nr:acyltransferase [Aurantimonas sp. MSK8Z-1]MCW4115105.1 acyltransferase [Aurantimonas sp. MSK8Z-1]